LTSSADDTYSTPIFSDDLPFVTDAGMSTTWSCHCPPRTGPLSTVPTSLPSTTIRAIWFAITGSTRRVNRTPLLFLSTATVNALLPPAPNARPSLPTLGLATTCGSRTRTWDTQPEPDSDASDAVAPGATSPENRVTSTSLGAGLGSRTPKARSRFTTSCAASRGSNVRTSRLSGNSR
jgi:hypothetical protein